MLMTILEIIIVGILAYKLGQAAFDKGYSNVLFIVLALLFWIFCRVLGNFSGYLVFESRLGSLVSGWLLAVLSYVLLFFILSRMEDKDPMNSNEGWQQRNNPNSAGTEKEEEK